MSDPRTVTLVVDGRPIAVRRGSLVASALLGAGIAAFRRSATGTPRGPVCGMGVCYECRLTIDGVPHRLGCQTPVAEGMEISTGDG